MKNIRKVLISIALISCLSLGMVGCQKTGDGGVENDSESVADTTNADADNQQADADVNGDDQQGDADSNAEDGEGDGDTAEEYVTVTDADGNAVTDSEGNPVTAKVVKTDSDSNTNGDADVSIQVVPVTDADGNTVTDSNGEIVTETQVVQINGNNNSNNNGNDNSSIKTVTVTDADGNTVTDSNGEAVTETQKVASNGNNSNSNNSNGGDSNNATTTAKGNSNDATTTTAKGNSNNSDGNNSNGDTNKDSDKDSNNATTTSESNSLYFAKTRYTTFLWMSDDTSNNYSSGAMAELTFKIADDAEPGVYPVEFNYIEIYDTNAEEVPFTVQNGSIEVGKDLSVTEQGQATSGVNYRMDTATAQPGDTVTLTVYLDNNSGMAITSVELKYDNNVLDMQSVKATGAFADQVIESNMNSENTRKQ
jgi:hypothetical protein